MLMIAIRALIYDLSQRKFGRAPGDLARTDLPGEGAWRSIPCEINQILDGLGKLKSARTDLWTEAAAEGCRCLPARRQCGVLFRAVSPQTGHILDTEPIRTPVRLPKGLLDFPVTTAQAGQDGSTGTEHTIIRPLSLLFFPTLWRRRSGGASTSSCSRASGEKAPSSLGMDEKGRMMPFLCPFLFALFS
jgi:hypothetical protein